MQNLLATVKPSGKLVADPIDFVHTKTFKKQQRKKLRKNSLIKKKEVKYVDYGVVRKFENVSYDHSFAYGNVTTTVDTDESFEESVGERKQLEEIKHLNPPRFFCDVPRKEFTHFVVEAKNSKRNESLYNLEIFRAMCQLDEQIQSMSFYSGFCEREYKSDTCCRSWSIPNYIALLAKRNNCMDITQEDVETVHKLLVKCYPFYRLEQKDCAFTFEDDKCLNEGIPNECLKENAVYGILMFLTDSEFKVS